MSELQWSNRLLKALSPDDQALLAPHLVPVALDVRYGMELPGKPVPFVYFMERGIVSVVARTGQQDRCIEAGLIGLERP